MGPSRGLGQDKWSLHGHGLKWPHLAEAGADVSTLTVKPDRKANASFTRLSQVLDSPLPELVTLGELWPLMYETTLHVPLGANLYGPLPVSLGGQMGVGAHGIDNAEISLPPTVIAVPVEERPKRDNPLSLQWELTECEKRSKHVVGDRLTCYRGHRMAFPTAEGQAALLHPLMVWWAVLYALSMLTRYHPAQWTALIDVNRSEQATALEFVLDVALAAVPDLWDEAVERVSIGIQTSVDCR